MVIKVCFLSLLNLCRNELEHGNRSTDVGTARAPFRARSRPCLVGSSPQASLEDSGWNHTFSRHGSASPGASDSEGWCWDCDPGLGCRGLTSSSPFDAFWNVPGSTGVSAPGTFKLTHTQSICRKLCLEKGFCDSEKLENHLPSRRDLCDQVCLGALETCVWSPPGAGTGDHAGDLGL